MLSRVAENLYWFARYIERAENTARIVNVNANLLMDTPKGITPGWQPLIDITGSAQLYRDHYDDFEERSAVRFLVGDMNNPASIASSLHAAREGARTIRDIMQREAWEQLNELYLYARESLQSGIGKRGRYAYLKRIILGAQTITGILSGTMNDDAGYRFVRLGRNLERADMTSRIIDVRSANLLADEHTGVLPYENVQWMSVLKSLSAYQMYRHAMQVRVHRAAVLQFLLLETVFPRSFSHCLGQVNDALGTLPNSEAPLRVAGRLGRLVQGTDVAALSQQDLHEFIDQLQIGLAQVHEAIALTYFLQPAVQEGQTQAQSA